MSDSTIRGRMEGKPKIAVVVGDLEHPRLLKMFCGLGDLMQFAIFTYNNSRVVNYHDTGLQLVLYDAIPDMPGYMRNLETDLKEYDAVITFETTRLTSFQASRAAKQHGLPLLVMTLEYNQDIYRDYPNIQAIQFDLMRNADSFLALSKRSERLLRGYGVEEDALFRLTPAVDTHKFSVDLAARQKFRNYIGIGANDIVILVQEDLEGYAHPEVCLQMLRHLKRDGYSEYSKIKVLFAGKGSAAQQEKYRAYDYGVAGQTLFLHQDINPFAKDLYCASDIVLKPQTNPTEFHESYPLPFLEAVACGAVPLVEKGALAGEFFAEEAGLVYDGPHQMVEKVKEGVGCVSIAAKKTLHALIHRKFGIDHAAALLKQTLVHALNQEFEVDRPWQNLDFTYINGLLQDNNTEEAMVCVEEALLREDLKPQQLSQLHHIKGETLYQQGDLENATESFAEALKHDERNADAYRGLGSTSWRAHSHEESLTFYKKALAINPKDVKTMLGIGMVYRRLGLIEEALFWLEKCIGIDPTSKPALAALSQACQDSTNMEQAIVVLQRLVDNVGEVPAVMMALGRLLIKTGQFEAGNSLVQRALQLGEGKSPAA